MAISISCPDCFMEYSVPERFAGRKIKCKSCGAGIPVPQPGTATAEDDEFGDLDEPAFRPTGAPPRRGEAHPARPASGGRRPPQKEGMSPALKWTLGIAGGLAVAVLVCCGGPLLILQRATRNVAVKEYPDLPDFGAATDLFPVSQIPVPKFPDLGPASPPEGVGESPVQTYTVDLGSVAGNEGWPGMKMAMRVYLPPGEHAPKSLPCVLVAPAGSTMLTGMSIDAPEYHDETLPYAEEGVVVIQYSIDGGDEVFDDENASMKTPYLHFRAACAGVVNTRNALEFALAKLPMVDPAKIYAAGHSSAGTLALLAAEHEPRLAGTIAYAPATDIEKNFKEFAEVPLVPGLMAPRLEEFATQSSPTTHVAKLKKPVFLFHAKGDDTVELADSERFAEKLRSQRTDVTFVAHDAAADETADEPAGDAPAAENAEPAGPDADAEFDEDWEDGDYVDLHYQPMIDAGIPQAIEWIKSRTGM